MRHQSTTRSHIIWPILMAIDHLGVGVGDRDRATTAIDSMHIEDIAAADDAAVREISAAADQGHAG